MRRIRLHTKSNNKFPEGFKMTDYMRKRNAGASARLLVLSSGAGRPVLRAKDR